MNDEPFERAPMNNEPEREPTDRARARVEALLKANAAPRCGARSKRTGKPCRGAAMPNGRCKLHGGKSTGPRTPEGLERSRRANWKHGHFSREAKAERRHYPRIIEGGKQLGWEWMGHGNNNSTLINRQSEDEERGLIKNVVDTIKAG